MTELQIAYLELAIVGGLGALLVIAGIVARALAKRANDSCTARTTGTVLKHRFTGEGRLYPVVQYEASGKNHQVRKRYNGVKLVRVTGLPFQCSGSTRRREGLAAREARTHGKCARPRRTAMADRQRYDRALRSCKTASQLRRQPRFLKLHVHDIHSCGACYDCHRRDRLLPYPTISNRARGAGQQRPCGSRSPCRLAASLSRRRAKGITCKRLAKKRRSRFNATARTPRSPCGRSSCPLQYALLSCLWK